MYKFLLLILATTWASVSYGQDFRTIQFDDLFQDLEVVPWGSGIMITKDGIPFFDHTQVAIPANTIKSLFFTPIPSDDKSNSANVYVVGTNVIRRATIIQKGTPTQRDVVIRILFYCKSRDGVKCRKELDSRLANDSFALSTGITDLENMTQLPEEQLVFALVYPPS